MPAGAGRPGQRFCLFHAAPGDAPRGQVLYVHPFAEEMNKTRRMAALQARALAQAGYAVLQPDLLGCGDSSGDFGDASWRDWIADVLEAARWLQRRSDAPLWLWGLRAGCLLANAAALLLPGPRRLLFCQPTPAGKTVLQQFLRLRTAAELLQGGSARAGGATDALRRQLAAGSSVEVAGYALSPQLAAGLEQATLRPPEAAVGDRLECIEVDSRAEASLSPATERLLAAWRVAGGSARGQAVTGPAFWQTTEIEIAPALLAATLPALAEEVAA